MSKPKRAVHAADLRHFADRLEKLQHPTHRNPEQPLLEKRALIQEMRIRASEVARMPEPPPVGVFASPEAATADGRVVVLDRSAAKARTGRVLLAIEEAA